MELDYSDIPRKEESLTLNYCSTCGRQLSHLSTNCRYGTFCLSQPTSSTSVHRTDSRSRTGTDLKTNYKTTCLCYCPPGTYCEATTQFGASCATASSSHPKIAMEDESKLSNLGSSGLSSPNSTNPNSWSPMSLNSIFSSVTSPDCYSDTSSISSNPLRYVPTRDRRRSKQQPYRNARHKISLPSSPAPTSPDPSTTILTPHEIKRETHELPDLSSFPVEKSRNDLVKQEGIEDEGLVHECRDRTEQTSPKGNSSNQPENSPLFATSEPQFITGLGDGSGGTFSEQGPGHGTAGPFDLGHMQELYNQVFLIELAVSKLRHMLGAQLSYLTHNGIPPNNEYYHLFPPINLQTGNSLPPVRTPELDLNYFSVPTDTSLGTAAEPWRLAHLPNPTQHPAHNEQNAAPITGIQEPLLSSSLSVPDAGAEDFSAVSLFSDFDLSLLTWNENAGLDPLIPYFYAAESSNRLDPSLLFNDTVEALVNPIVSHMPDDAITGLSTATYACDPPRSINSGPSCFLDNLETPGFTEPYRIPAPAHSDSSSPLLHAATQPSNCPIASSGATDAPPPNPDMTSDMDGVRVVCDVDGCGKTFRRPYLLRDHMRAHQGETNTYRCTFEDCTRRFGSQSNLTRHYKKHSKQAKANIQSHDKFKTTIFNHPTDGAGSVQTDATTPRRSRRLQNTASNRVQYHILEPRTPATIEARMQSKPV